MIQINQCNFSYPGTKKKVFEDFSLTIGKGGIYGLLGKNGSGKSTLLYLLSGLLHAQSGEVMINGCNMRLRKASVLADIFIVPEEYTLPSMSLKSFVHMQSMFYPRFSETQFYDCLNDFGLSADFHMRELSMGQKKKVYMSMALSVGTSLVLMDEPTNGLDIPSKSLFRKVVSANMRDESTFLISTHQVHDIEALLDHVIIISPQGVLLDSSVEDLSRRYDFLTLSPGEDTTDAIYVEPSLLGCKAVFPHKEGGEETPVDIELLFSSLTNGNV